MALVQTEPKKIYLGTNEVKGVFYGETKVRPAGWNPGADTIAYYPLSGDYNDHSGNGNNLTTVNGTGFATEGDLTYAEYNESRYEYSPSLTVPSTYTILAWHKYTGVYNSGTLYYLSDYRTSRWTHEKYNTSFNFYMMTGDYGYSSSSISGLTTSQWYLLAYVKNSTGYKVYMLNSGTPQTYEYSVTYNKSFTMPLYIGAKGPQTSMRFKGGISEFIVEGKEWTESNIIDYFNLTKSKYGY